MLIGHVLTHIFITTSARSRSVAASALMVLCQDSATWQGSLAAEKR